MKTLHLDTWCRDGCTIGTLSFGMFRCLTLELPWEDNKPSVSCIPAGEYEAKLYQSNKHGDVVLLEGVPGRTFIEIHAGNYVSQIEGCILVGDGIKYLNKDDVLDVTNSLVTLRRLIARLPDRFTVSVDRAFNSGAY